MIDAQRAIELLQQQINKNIELLSFEDPEVDRWWTVTERIVEEAFGKNSKNYSHFVCTYSYGTTWEERQESHVSSIQGKKGMLRGFVDQLAMFPAPKPPHGGQNAIIRRKILEQLSEAAKTSSAKPFVNYRSLPIGLIWAPDLLLDQLEILEHEGRVELKRMGDECAAKMTPLGSKSLEAPEEEWERRTASSVVNMTRMDISHSQIGNIAQLTGSHGAAINQTQTKNDLADVYATIDRLLQTLKSSASVSAETKNDSEIEADQLRGELRKSKPNPNRIRQALDWFKGLDGAVQIGVHLVELTSKLRELFPGLFQQG